MKVSFRKYEKSTVGNKLLQSCPACHWLNRRPETQASAPQTAPYFGLEEGVIAPLTADTLVNSALMKIFNIHIF